jgi:hypothetical protein
MKKYRIGDKIRIVDELPEGYYDIRWLFADILNTIQVIQDIYKEGDIQFYKIYYNDKPRMLINSFIAAKITNTKLYKHLIQK